MPRNLVPQFCPPGSLPPPGLLYNSTPCSATRYQEELYIDKIVRDDGKRITTTLKIPTGTNRLCPGLTTERTLNCTLG